MVFIKYTKNNISIQSQKFREMNYIFLIWLNYVLS